MKLSSSFKKIVAEPDDLLKGVTCCLPLSQSPSPFSSSAFPFSQNYFLPVSCKTLHRGLKAAFVQTAPLIHERVFCT
jgi:hypothetical protein